jgi:acyl carrier protein
MSRTETFEQLKKLIVEMLEVDESKVVPKASFADDFEADSLDFIELITAVEDTFKIEIPDEDAENLQTVQDALDYIESKI